MAIDPEKTFTPINIAVLTVSDTRTPETDTSGDILVKRLEDAGHTLAARLIVKDDAGLLAAQLEQWIDDPEIDAIVSTGGTGLTGRDVTPEALERIEPGSSAVVAPASGSLELPTIAGEAAMSGDYDAVVALGCVIKGETDHDRHISQAIIGALTQTSVTSGVPIGIGVLTVNDAAQAEARAGGKFGNKGAEAMEAAIASARVLRGLRRLGEDDGSTL